MNKGKPRGPVPSLIGSTLGTPRRIQTKNKAPCKRCKVSLPGGVEYIGIPQLGSGFSKPARYCDECFRAIIEKTRADLAELEALSR